MATIASDGSRTDVQNKINGATAGDIITIPAGTFSWTTTVDIGKGITLQGLTTVNATDGTASDVSIIQDNIASDIPAIGIDPASGVARVTGLTFNKGSTTTSLNSGMVMIYGPQSASARVDHCHFTDLYHNKAVSVAGSTYGLIDHNFFDYGPSALYVQSILVRMGDWNGDTNGIGDKTFSDYPWFGTEKFIFIEDNYFKNTSSFGEIEGTIDADFGGRMVVRYNHFYDVQIQNHGTEGRYRGTRACEIYNNDFHLPSTRPMGGIRTGVYLIHDNTWAGAHCTGWDFSYLRGIFSFANPFGDGFGGTTGDATANQGIWDVNATESDGTHVDGHAPYLFASGTATTGSGDGVLVASGSPGWTTNQWAGFTVKRVSDNAINIVVSNTSNTLTLTTIFGGYGSSPTWTSGDSFQIHKALILIDQPGRGKGDEIYGGWNKWPTTTTNLVSGIQSWPNQALEPCYSWNNTNSFDSTTVNFQTSSTNMGPAPVIIDGRDFFTDSSNSAVIAKYVAALNGQDYVGTYTYPHPLQGSPGSGVPGDITVDNFTVTTLRVGS